MLWEKWCYLLKRILIRGTRKCFQSSNCLRKLRKYRCRLASYNDRYIEDWENIDSDYLAIMIDI